MSSIPFQSIHWDKLEKLTYPGQKGVSFGKLKIFEGLRIRMIEYQAGYLADHWCEKGHIVHCLFGEFSVVLKTGEKINFMEGMSFIVSDNLSSHFIIAEKGAKLLVIDGDFLSS